MSDYYDQDGQPMSRLAWAQAYESDDRVLARTELPGGVWISTVWMGLDHSFVPGPPLIFESMVFPSKDDFGDLDCRRYATKADALAGHEQLVTKWTGWMPGDPEPGEE